MIVYSLQKAEEITRKAKGMKCSHIHRLQLN